jgi:repressor LexA
MSPRAGDSALLTETYEAIRDFIAENGWPPTRRQLGEILGLSSSSSVQERLDALVRAGMVEVDPKSPRAIRLKEVAEPVGGEAREVEPPTGSAPNDYRGADHE